LAQAIGQTAIQQGYKVLYRETHILLIKGGAIIDHETPRERRIVAVEK
jgi:hypothetical protein